MISDPRLLILDEPTTALDVTTQIEVLYSFKKLIKDNNTAAIYVTHDLSLVAQIADHILVLRDGKMVERVLVSHFHSMTYSGIFGWAAAAYFS